MDCYRQGDVLIIKVQKAAAKNAAKEIPHEGGRIVLAHGEVTGHSHAIADLNARFALNEQTLRRFLVVKGHAVTLCHEEHAPIQLPAGVYEVRIQREYFPAGIRNVAD